MKAALVAFALLLSQGSVALAGQTEVVLNCQITSGPLQQARILKTADGLKLEELTNTGSFKLRLLSEDEIESNEIRLRADSPFEAGTLTLEENGAWFYDFTDAKGYCR